MAYRRARGDMIEIFKIVAQIYDNKTTDNILSFRENMNISAADLDHKREITETTQWRTDRDTMTMKT